MTKKPDKNEHLPEEVMARMVDKIPINLPLVCSKCGRSYLKTIITGSSKESTKKVTAILRKTAGACPKCVIKKERKKYG